MFFYERSERHIPSRTVTQKSIPLGPLKDTIIPRAHENLLFDDKYSNESSSSESGTCYAD